ncbi:MAG: IS110 family transposase [Anaerolineae bacterium]|nr:IS110 family transposase [Anaerolineae bacterium]
MRTVLVECAWAAVRYAPFWKVRFERLRAQVGKQKAIVAIARKLLVVIWHVLAKREADRQADPQAIARSLMKWASAYRTATASGLSRADFVWRELDRLGLGQQVSQFSYSGQLYVRQPDAPPAVRGGRRSDLTLYLIGQKTSYVRVTERCEMRTRWWKRLFRLSQ